MSRVAPLCMVAFLGLAGTSVAQEAPAEAPWALKVSVSGSVAGEAIARVANNLARELGADLKLRTSSDGEQRGQVELTIDADGASRVETVGPRPSHARIRLRPNAVSVDEPVVGVVVGVVRGFSVVLARTLGVWPTEAVKALGAARHGLRQLDEIELEIGGDRAAGFDIDLALYPRSDTALARWVEAATPLPGGAPLIREPGATFDLRIAMAPAAWRRLAHPVVTEIACRRSRTPAESERIAGRLLPLVAQLDGALAVSWNQERGTLSMLVGLADAAEYAGAVDDDDLRHDLGIRELGGVFGVAAPGDHRHRHRGVSVHWSPTGLAARDGGFPPEIRGEVQAYTMIAGGYRLLLASDGGRDAVRAAVDRLVEGRVVREPLDDRALVLGEFAPGPLLSWLAEQLNEPGLDGLVQRLAVAVRREDGSLRVRIRAW